MALVLPFSVWQVFGGLYFVLVAAVSLFNAAIPAWALGVVALVAGIALWVGK